MRFQVEARVPFLDPAVVRAALRFTAAELVSNRGDRPVGKQPLRALYGLYPQALPAEIGRRIKVGLHIGSGLDGSIEASPWRELAEARISDLQYRDEGRRLAAFGVRSKEELHSLLALERRMEVHRVPHLKLRSFLKTPSPVADAVRASAPTLPVPTARLPAGARP